MFEVFWSSAELLCTTNCAGAYGARSDIEPRWCHAAAMLECSSRDDHADLLRLEYNFLGSRILHVSACLDNSGIQKGFHCCGRRRKRMPATGMCANVACHCAKIACVASFGCSFKAVLPFASIQVHVCIYIYIICMCTYLRASLDPTPEPAKLEGSGPHSLRARGTSSAPSLNRSFPRDLVSSRSQRSTRVHGSTLVGDVIPRQVTVQLRQTDGFQAWSKVRGHSLLWNRSSRGQCYLRYYCFSMLLKSASRFWPMTSSCGTSGKVCSYAGFAGCLALLQLQSGTRPASERHVMISVEAPHAMPKRFGTSQTIVGKMRLPSVPCWTNFCLMQGPV